MMSPMALFLHADAVVKIVMIGLLLASVWTWAIIFTHALRLRRINRATERYEADFWAADDIDAFHAKRGQGAAPDRRRARRRARRMAPLDRAAARSTAPAPASGWRRG